MNLINEFLKNTANSKVFAAVDADTLNEVSKILEVVDIIGMGLNIVIFIAGAVFTAYLILGAYKFLTAQGDPKGIAGAKQSLTYAVMGICVVVSAVTINTIIAGILGLDTSKYGKIGGPNSGILGAFKNALDELLTWIQS